MRWLKEITRSRNRRSGQIFDRQAARYVSKRAFLGLCSPERFGEALAEALSGQRRRRALDVGGGTGLLTRYLAARCEEVVLLDISPKMLEQARRDLAAQDNVSFVQGDVFADPLDEGSFDLVMCTDVLHHTGRHAELLSRMIRLLEPGGSLVVMEYAEGRLHTRLAVLVEDMFLEDIQLIDPGTLERICRAQGVDGASRMISSWEYLFVGTKAA